MKNRAVLFISMFLLGCNNADGKNAQSGDSTVPDGTIKVFTSPDLYNLTAMWVEQYSNLNLKSSIQVIKTDPNQISEKVESGEGMSFISGRSNPKLINHSLWNMVVGRDVIVPVMNAKNPYLDEINLKGISVKRLSEAIKTQANQNWGKLIGNSQSASIHFYVDNDPSVISGVGNLLDTNLPYFDAVNAVDVHELISIIQHDVNAIGFCKLMEITDLDNQSLITGLKLVPFDKNGNGKIDYVENIYDNLQTFNRAVWIGKYPKELTANIYSVANLKPVNEDEVAFLKWVLTDGQQYLTANGHGELVYAERLTRLANLDKSAVYADMPVESTNSIFSILLFVLVAIIAVSVVFDLVFIRRRNRKDSAQGELSDLKLAFDEESVKIPKGIYFDKTHTWAFMRKNGSVKIGIDDFLQHVTGKITRVEMKTSGDIIKKGELLLSVIRKGKLLNIYSPISGIITENNESLLSNSSLVNSAPYSEGWVYVVEPVNWELEIQYLNPADKYKTWLKDEFVRLKDFLAKALNGNSPEYAVVLQDGGAIKNHVLADLKPEVWEDFQTAFIDVSK
jgi:glycine cleavage system H lipoate-binding protein/ABC-type phosphate transport system substrate-binding protein